MTSKLWLSTIGAVALSAALATPAAAEDKKLTLLTWNLPIYEEKFRGWIADFQELHPGFEVEWLDKKGTEWATFYQTQLVAGTAPDIIDVQGMLWAEYAAADGLVDLSPYLEKDPAESADLAPADPERVADLGRALEARVAELERVAHVPASAEMTRGQRNQLEALGYVGD